MRIFGQTEYAHQQFNVTRLGLLVTLYSMLRSSTTSISFPFKLNMRFSFHFSVDIVLFTMKNVCLCITYNVYHQQSFCNATADLAKTVDHQHKHEAIGKIQIQNRIQEHLICRR